MSTGDVLAVVAATIVTVLVAVLAIVLVLLDAHAAPTARRRSRCSKPTRLSVLDDARVSVEEAANEIDRVERLVTSAERLDDTKRAIATPVVKVHRVRYRRVARRASSARRRTASASRTRTPSKRRRSAS